MLLNTLVSWMWSLQICSRVFKLLQIVHKLCVENCEFSQNVSVVEDGFMRRIVQPSLGRCRRASLDSTFLFASRSHRNQVASYVSLSSSGSRMLQHSAILSLFARMPDRFIGSVNLERRAAMASLAADQETVPRTESEVEIVLEEEKVPIILPTNESSENLLKIRHTVSKQSLPQPNCIHLPLQCTNEGFNLDHQKSLSFRSQSS